MKKFIVYFGGLLSFSLMFSTHQVLGCATDLKKMKTPAPATAWSKYWNAHASSSKRDPKSARMPSSDSTGWSADRQWGGNNSAAWKPEAIVANAASDALDRGFARAGAQEVLVSIPLKMLYGPTRPYGDGQTNAAVSFGSFAGKAPPIVASWIVFSDGTKILNIRANQIDGILETGHVTIDFANGSKPISLGTPHMVQKGIYEISWKATQIQWGDLYQNHVAYLSLPGVARSFPLDFRDTVKPVAELLANVPSQNRNLVKGSLLDPEWASSQSENMSMSPFAKMYANNPNPSCASGCPAGPNDFGGDVHAMRYSPVVGVHNQFVYANGTAGTTAVGNGDTTLILPPNAPFKLAYICFDGRNLTAEKSFGTPSGGGWHEIGDDAETVMNTLENASPIFGYANGKPGDDREYQYGLSDIALIRRLRPGAALITAVGTTTAAEGYSSARGRGPANGRNYHWFAFDQPTEVCAVEWVHPCIPTPSNQIGLNCSK